MPSFKIVANEDSRRAETFKACLSSAGFDVVGEIDMNVEPMADHNIFFESDLLARPDIVVEKVISLIDVSNIIYDVIDVYNENEAKETANVLMLNQAGYVTCASPFAQEAVYDLTGKLATIVEEVEDKDKFLAPDVITDVKKILWFGIKEDSIGLNRSNPNIVFKYSPCKINFDKYDIVFLPPTFTAKGEARRYEKAKEAVRMGKFVIADNLLDGNTFIEEYGSDLSSLPSSTVMTRAIKKSQSKLLKLVSKKEQVKAINRMLKFKPEPLEMHLEEVV